MKVFTYNKLVRDNIPALIKAKGHTAITEILDDETYIKMLNDKLREELEEYEKDYSIEELADLYEVIIAIAETRGINLNEFIKIALSKKEKRGGFKEKIFLKQVIEE